MPQDPYIDDYVEVVISPAVLHMGVGWQMIQCEAEPSSQQEYLHNIVYQQNDMVNYYTGYRIKWFQGYWNNFVKLFLFCFVIISLFVCFFVKKYFVQNEQMVQSFKPSVCISTNNSSQDNFLMQVLIVLFCFDNFSKGYTKHGHPTISYFKYLQVLKLIVIFFSRIFFFFFLSRQLEYNIKK